MDSKIEMSPFPDGIMDMDVVDDQQSTSSDDYESDMDVDGDQQSALSGSSGSDDDQLSTSSGSPELRDFSKIPAFAARIRQQASIASASPSDSSCVMETQIMKGSFNTVRKIVFSDGVTWVAKIPIRGTAGLGWDECKARHMTNTVELMRFLKASTIVPVPEVYAFSSSLDNELGYPFILEEFIHGTTIDDAWIKSDGSDNDLKRKAQTIHDLAKVMVDLSRYKFSKIGAPLFENGQLVHRDDDADGDVGPFLNTGLREEGPYDNLDCYMKRTLNEQERELPLDFYTMSLHMMMDWLLSLVYIDGYTLFHPDLNEGNIIIDNDTGCLQGIIDWDFTRAEPTAMGIRSYPIFLTRDFDPETQHPDQYFAGELDVCEHSLCWNLEPGETGPLPVYGRDFRQHEAHDLYRALWRKCVDHFTHELDSNLPLSDLPIERLLVDTPNTYEDGLSQAECISPTVFRDAGFFTRMIRQVVGHVYGKIWYMELTTPQLIDQHLPEFKNGGANTQAQRKDPHSGGSRRSSCSDANSWKTIGSDESENPDSDACCDDDSNATKAIECSHRVHLPHYTNFKKALKNGRIHEDYMKIVVVWFRYLIYLPEKYDIPDSELLDCFYGAETFTCADVLQQVPAKKSEVGWQMYLESRGEDFKPYIDNPYPDLEDEEEDENSGVESGSEDTSSESEDGQESVENDPSSGSSDPESPGSSEIPDSVAVIDQFKEAKGILLALDQRNDEPESFVGNNTAAEAASITEASALPKPFRSSYEDIAPVPLPVENTCQTVDIDISTETCSSNLSGPGGAVLASGHASQSLINDNPLSETGGTATITACYTITNHLGKRARDNMASHSQDPVRDAMAGFRAADATSSLLKLACDEYDPSVEAPDKKRQCRGSLGTALCDLGRQIKPSFKGIIRHIRKVPHSLMKLSNSQSYPSQNFTINSIRPTDSDEPINLSVELCKLREDQAELRKQEQTQKAEQAMLERSTEACRSELTLLKQKTVQRKAAFRAIALGDVDLEDTQDADNVMNDDAECTIACSNVDATAVCLASVADAPKKWIKVTTPTKGEFTSKLDARQALGEIAATFTPSSTHTASTGSNSKGSIWSRIAGSTKTWSRSTGSSIIRGHESDDGALSRLRSTSKKMYEVRDARNTEDLPSELRGQERKTKKEQPKRGKMSPKLLVKAIWKSKTR